MDLHVDLSTDERRALACMTGEERDAYLEQLLDRARFDLTELFGRVVAPPRRAVTPPPIPKAALDAPRKATVRADTGPRPGAQAPALAFNPSYLSQEELRIIAEDRRTRDAEEKEWERRIARARSGRPQARLGRAA
jgi:hypothetical protein